MQFVLNQFPRNSKHVSRLPCEGVPIFMEEFDERKLLFGIQIVADVRNLGRPLHGQRNHLVECVLQLDGCLGGLGLGHDRASGGLGQSLLQLLELYGRCHFVSYLATLPVIVKSPLDVSPDGDDAMWPWHLKDQVGVMWDRHELGECWSSQESIIRSLEITDRKLYSLRAEIFLSPEGYGNRDLTNGGCYYTRDYAMERSPTGVL
jgi:hypothetical protein